MVLRVNWLIWRLVQHPQEQWGCSIATMGDTVGWEEGELKD